MVTPNSGGGARGFTIKPFPFLHRARGSPVMHQLRHPKRRLRNRQPGALDGDEQSRSSRRQHRLPRQSQRGWQLRLQRLPAAPDEPVRRPRRPRPAADDEHLRRDKLLHQRRLPIHPGPVL